MQFEVYEMSSRYKARVQLNNDTKEDILHRNRLDHIDVIVKPNQGGAAETTIEVHTWTDWYAEEKTKSIVLGMLGLESDQMTNWELVSRLIGAEPTQKLKTNIAYIEFTDDRFEYEQGESTLWWEAEGIRIYGDGFISFSHCFSVEEVLEKLDEFGLSQLVVDCSHLV